MNIVLLLRFANGSYRQTIFNCDFNTESSINCAFLPSTGPNLFISSGALSDFTSSKKPIQPLSDATSVSKFYFYHLFILIC